MWVWKENGYSDLMARTFWISLYHKIILVKIFYAMKTTYLQLDIKECSGIGLYRLTVSHRSATVAHPDGVLATVADKSSACLMWQCSGNVCSDGCSYPIFRLSVGQCSSNVNSDGCSCPIFRLSVGQCSGNVRSDGCSCPIFRMSVGQCSSNGGKWPNLGLSDEAMLSQCVQWWV